MKRRDFLKRGITIAGSLLAGGHFSEAAAAQALATLAGYKPATTWSKKLPLQNKAPLRPTPLLKLPIGSIKPKGWLLRQLALQTNGLNGRMPEVSDYLQYEGNGWVTPGSHIGWEEVPYWLRGFGDLGYVTGDSRVQALALKWIDGILNSQQADGWFGPDNLRTSLNGGPDMWPHMLVQDALRSYHEFSGDGRVLTFLTSYARFQDRVAPAQFSLSWAALRWGDNIDTLHWLYNRTGERWLLNLAARIHDNSARWSKEIASWHNVNIAQGFREGAQFWQQSGAKGDLDSAYRNYDEVMANYGQFPGGGFAGDENCRPSYSDPRQGFETCGIVELMRSCEILTRITGDPVWSDRCEELAFNSLPAALDPRQKGTHYITSANSISLDSDPKGPDFDNGFPMQAYMPGVHNYRCCPHNYGIGWPYYAEEMWLGTDNGGLCATLYGASEVRAQVGRTREWVTLKQETHYPFGEAVRFTIESDSGEPVEFPLKLRIPGWCRQARVVVNGKGEAQLLAPGTYATLARSWNTGDIVELELPMPITVKQWPANHKSVSVHRGPLAYSLAIEEEWRQTGGSTDWPEFEVHPRSAWNYGLALPNGSAETSSAFTINRNLKGSLDDPWSPESAPLTLTAPACKIPEWRADEHNVVGLLQQSPAKSDEPLEKITLIPMGAARLRIASFPTVGNGVGAHQWTPAQDAVDKSNARSS